MTYRAFSSAMKTSNRPLSLRQPSYTDKGWERKKDEWERQANTQHSREMHRIMKGKR